MKTKISYLTLYTNKITNEYNDYVRQMKISDSGKPLDIDIRWNW